MFQPAPFLKWVPGTCVKETKRKKEYIHSVAHGYKYIKETWGTHVKMNPM